MQPLQQVANYLQISENNIKHCEEWAEVYFVVVAGCRPRFVSKKGVKKMQISISIQLPELRGTEKQVVWANQIRLNALKYVQTTYDKRGCEHKQAVIVATNYVLSTMNSASWWIESREKVARHLLKKIDDRYEYVRIFESSEEDEEYLYGH